MLRPGAFIAAARLRVQRPADTIQWLLSEWHLGQFTWQAAAGLNSGDSPYNEHTLECVLQSTSEVQRPKWKEAKLMPSCSSGANFNTSDGTNGCEEMERPTRPPLPQKYCHCQSEFTVMNESFRQTFQQNDDHDDLLDLLIRPPLFLSLSASWAASCCGASFTKP